MAISASSRIISFFLLDNAVSCFHSLSIRKSIDPISFISFQTDFLFERDVIV